MEPNSKPPGFEQPVTPEVVDRPRTLAPRKRTHRLSLLLIVLLVLALGGSALLNLVLLAGRGSFDSGRRVREEFYSHARSGRHKIAIIAVEGVILDGDGFVKRQIDRVAEDEAVKAVVLRVNSPGGTVTGSDYLYHHLAKLAEESEIPMVVSMGGLAASGGYYVSMAVGKTPDSIFAEPNTWTGSIGVIIPHYNASELLNSWGVKEDSIASHPLKGMGSFAKPMTEKEREIFQALVDNSFDRFKEVVKRGRPKFQEDPDALDKLATGQIFDAQQAKQSGLVDRIGFLEDALDRAIELAGLDEKDVRVVRYKPEPTLASILFGRTPANPRLDLTTLLDMATPRAYYLCTRLPPLVRSGQ